MGKPRLFCQTLCKPLTVGVLSLASVYISAKPINFWVGANTAGIYAGTLETTDGSIYNLRQVVRDIDAYYIVKHPQRPILYAAIRTNGPSKIASFHIAKNGELRLQSLLDERPHGASHVNVSPDGRLLVVAYYRTGITGLYQLSPTGELKTVLDEVQHSGHSIDAQRQEAPHPHWGGFSADNQFIYVPDLGNDNIWVYTLTNGQENALQLIQKSPAPVGSGPRHMALHPTLNIAYVSDELKSRVSRYRVEKNSGKLHYLDSMPPAEETNEERWHSVSDIRIHPSGQFLYLVNRGLDRVSVFIINQDNGTLTPVEREPIRGSISRNINFTADGKWALVAGRDSSTLAVFHVDSKTGKLQYIQPIYSLPTPMAIVIDNERNDN